MYYHIQNAACLKDHFIYLKFVDGMEGVVNFEGIVGRGEAFAPLADMDYFCRVRLDNISHTIEWPNGADICPEILYETVKSSPNAIAMFEL